MCEFDFRQAQDLDYCRVHYEMILVLVQLLSFYKRYRYATSAVVPLGLVLSLNAVYIMLFTGWKGEEWYSVRPYRYDEAHR
jgi:uncharacterized membrane protein